MQARSHRRLARALAVLGAGAVTVALAPAARARAAAPTFAQEARSQDASGAPADREDPRASPLPGPPPRAPIAGLHGYTSVSELVFDADPERTVHRLECCEIFPARSRWSLEVRDGTVGRRVLQHRYGEQAYQVPAYTSASGELLGVERLEQILQMELRRALFLYPDGFDWQIEDRLARADLGATGLLIVTLGDDGRPTSVSSLTATGELRDAYKELAWQTIGERTWPAHAVLYQPDGKVWVEDVVQVRTSPRYVDSFFRPADRRAPGKLDDVDGVLAQSIDLLPAVRRRRELDLADEWTWEQALARAGALEREATEALDGSGWSLEPALWLELDEGGAPRAAWLELRARTDGAAPPTGWETVPSRAAVSLVLPRGDRIRATTLASLREAARALGAAGGTTALRVRRELWPAAPVQLVLVLEE